MKIALDYDGTYTEGPDMWDDIIEIFQTAGHSVHLVTFRGEDMWCPTFDYLEDMGVEVVCTNRHPKKEYCESLGLEIDIWIDDNPDLIINKSDWTNEQYDDWKKTVPDRIIKE